MIKISIRISILVSFLVCSIFCISAFPAFAEDKNADSWNSDIFSTEKSTQQTELGNDGLFNSLSTEQKLLFLQNQDVAAQSNLAQTSTEDEKIRYFKNLGDEEKLTYLKGLSVAAEVFYFKELGNER